MILNPGIVEQMIAHAEREAPVEACGYLLGARNRITRHVPMTNTDHSEDHFTFDPAAQFAVAKAARKDGLTLTGIYHSHPSSPARPSAEDVKLAFDPALVYVIISLMNGTKTVKGFHIRQGTVEAEHLIIEEEHK